MLNTRQLHYVITVANEKSISLAAKKLLISQPSLSQYIQKLEKELGVELFERTNPLRLTYAGEIFLRSAKKMLNTEEEMNRILKDISEERSGRIIVGTGYYNSTVFLPQVLEVYFKDYPDVEIEVVEKIEPQLRELARNGEVDLVIATEQAEDMDFQVIPLAQEEFLLAVPKKIAEKVMGDEVKENLSCIDVTMFSEEPYIILGTQVYINRLLEKICQNNGFTPKKTLTCTSLNAAYAMTKAGVGLTVVPYSTYRYDRSENVVYYKIENNNVVRGLNMYYKKDRYLTKIMKRFIHVCRELADDSFGGDSAKNG